MSTIAEAEKAVKFNVFYAKKNVVDSIWKEAIIEGVNITYPQAKVIVEHNQTVEGLTVTGTITVYNLKLAWNYLFEHLNSLVDFEFVAKINSILGASLVHNAGCIRDIPVGISGTSILQKPLSRKLRIWNLGENGRLRCSVIFVVPNFLVMEISERHSSWQTRC